ncbi:MAG: hypothetical protein AAF363_08150 [Bacteroidota bacterium]
MNKKVENFHEAFDVFLKAINHSAASFEKEMGFSNGSISKAIKGKKSITSDRLEKIFSVYKNLNPDFLWMRTDNIKIDPNCGFKEEPKRISVKAYPISEFDLNHINEEIETYHKNPHDLLEMIRKEVSDEYHNDIEFLKRYLFEQERIKGYLKDRIVQLYEELEKLK